MTVANAAARGRSCEGVVETRNLRFRHGFTKTKEDAGFNPEPETGL
jgi:hypothetical protein